MKTQGNLTFTPDQPLSDGQHTISVTVTDIAGNTKTSAELQIEIDTQVQIDSVTLTTDSGVNDHDNVTNATRPSFEIATPDDVTSVLVSFDGVNWTPISKMRPGSGNLLQVAHCLMVIILSMSGRRIGQEIRQIPRWASPWIRRLTA